MQLISRVLVFAAIAFACASNAYAQEFPSRPIHIVVSSGPGGSLDIIARTVGQKLSENLKVPVIVDNRPGASGIIGVTHGARAAPDGYTITVGTTGTFPINFVTRKSLAYHPIKDFIPVSWVAEGDYLLSVHPSVPVKNLQDFIALAKSKPGEITYSSFGPGSLSHVFMEAFALAAGVKLIHVPYKSGPDALQGVVAGQVQASFDTALVMLEQVRDGRLRALATGGAKRSAMAPDIPTFAEAGLPGFASRGWFGLFAPAATPGDIARKLQTEIAKALADPELRGRLEKAGLTVVGGDPAKLTAQIEADIKLYGQVAKDAKIQLD
jgi:tripartite-type tricarboxylate transporter receptor subunit TctC